MVADINSVTVTARISPEGTVRREFGRTLYVDLADAVVTEKEAAQRIRTVPVYTSAKAVADDSPNASLRAASSVYFQQSPYPRNLLVGTIIAVAQPSLVFGVDAGAIADIEALGSVTIDLNGTDVAVDFDTDATLADVAASLQTGIQAIAAPDWSAVTVTADGGALRIQGGDDFDFGTGFEADSTTALLGLTGTGVVVVANQDDETIEEGLDRIENLNDSFYWVGLNDESSLDSTDVLAFATWIAARDYFTIIDVAGSAVLTANETASIGAQLFARGNENVAAIYNGDSIDHKGLSFMARFSSVNFDGTRTIITGKFKSLPGTTANVLTGAQREELDRKRINFYYPVSDVNIAAEGKSFGTWIDVRFFVDWLRNEILTNVFTTLQTSNVVPQTETGQGAIIDSVVAALNQGVTNGGLAPNTVSTAMQAEIIDATGNIDFDGFLSLGWLTHSEPLADQSTANRNARMAQPVSVWAKGSGAVHFADINLLYEG